MKKIILLLSICIIFNNVNANPNSTLPASSNQPSIAEFLQPDGTLDLSKNFRGNLNLSGFNVQMDECKGLVATPQSSTQIDHCQKEDAINSTWSGLVSSSGINGVSTNGNITDVAIDGSNNVYVVGSFTTLGDETTIAYRIAKWDGTNWSPLISSSGVNGVGNTIYTLRIDGNNNLYVGGAFTTLGDGTTTVNYIAKWDGTDWSPLISISGINGLGLPVISLAIDGSNNLYVGGAFTTLGDGTTAANRMVKWDGANWSALISSGGINGLSSPVTSLAIDGSNNLYAGGSFTTLGDGTTAANRIAKWDGTNWSALTSSGGINGLSNSVFTLAIDGNNNLYAGGYFTTLGDGTTVVNRVAKWDGTDWSPLISSSNINGLGHDVLALVIDGNNNLYINGTFTTLGDGTTTANRIVKWDGANWSTLGTGLEGSGPFGGLALGTDGLYAGNHFTTAGGVTANRIAKWNGVSLPVELTQLNVEATANNHLLTWQTASEKNNEGFDIQRSADGRDWENIGFVQGHGTTQATQEYSFTDENPMNGTNYYRLKQVDFDQEFEYSKVVNIEFHSTTQQLEIYPNPVTDELTIINGAGIVTIYNLLGQPIKRLNINRIQFAVNTTDLPQGQYILHIQKENGNVLTKAFVK